MCIYCSIAEAVDNVSTVKRTEAKMVENWFLVSCKTPQCTQQTLLFSKGY